MISIQAVLRTVLMVTILLVVGFEYCTYAQNKTDYRIDGASLFFSYIEPWAKDYAKQVPTCNPIIMGSKTGKGYRGWIAGKVDIVAASREMTDEERTQAAAKGRDIQVKKIGVVPLAVVVNMKNPIKTLNLEQLRQIFTGKVTNWKDVGGLNKGITVTTRAVPETGTGTLFQKNILQGEAYIKGHLVMPHFSTTAKIVGSKPDAIGYIPTTDPALNRRGVKVIGVQLKEGLESIVPTVGPSKETDFPVKIPFLLVWDGNSDKASCLSAYAEFCDKQVK